MAQEINKLSPPTMIVCGIITFVVIGLIGYWEYSIRAEVAQTLKWPVCEGHVAGVPGKTMFLTYTYKVGGKEYSAERIQYDEEKKRHHFLSDTNYKLGQSVQVHYDPAQPQSAVLSTKSAWGPTGLGGYLIGLFFGTGLLFRGIRNAYLHRHKG